MKKSTKKNSKKIKKFTDYQNVMKLLEELKLPFEKGTNDGIRPYLFINFNNRGKAIYPC